MSHERLAGELAIPHPLADTVIETPVISGCPRDASKERTPGFSKISKFCTIVDSPDPSNEMDTSIRRDLPSERVIVKSHSRPSDRVHTVDSNERDIDWLSITWS